jgi:hypothetical protein
MAAGVATMTELFRDKRRPTDHNLMIDPPVCRPVCATASGQIGQLPVGWERQSGQAAMCVYKLPDADQNSFGPSKKSSSAK